MNSTELAGQTLPQRFKDKLKRKLGAWGVFFEGFLRNPVMVGSIIPSSQYTVEKMLSRVDWQNCKLFVEYGPGIGTYCQPILDKLPRDGTLIVIDTNPLFIDYLRRTISDSRFIPVLGSAADVQDIIRSHGHEQADYVVSGLPFSTLPAGVGPAIAKATYEVLRPGGNFLVYQYSARCRDFMALHFKRIDKDMAWINIPPCQLFWGWKDKPKA